MENPKAGAQDLDGLVIDEFTVEVDSRLHRFPNDIVG